MIFDDFPAINLHFDTGWPEATVLFWPSEMLGQDGLRVVTPCSHSFHQAGKHQENRIKQLISKLLCTVKSCFVLGIYMFFLIIYKHLAFPFEVSEWAKHRMASSLQSLSRGSSNLGRWCTHIYILMREYLCIPPSTNLFASNSNVHYLSI